MLAVCLVLFAIPLEATQRRRADAREKPIELARLTARAAAVELARDDRDGKRLQSLATTTLGALGRDRLARVLIVDKRGRRLADTASSVLRQRIERPELARALDGREAQLTRDSRDLGAKIRVTAAPIAGGRAGAVRITEGAAAIDARVAAQRRRVLTVGAVVAVSALALAVALARLLVRPIWRLERSVQRISGGELSARAAVSGSREQRLLAAAFNDMARRLEQMIERQRAFAANASHQLRTPLTGLRLRLELLRRVVDGNAGAVRHTDAAVGEVDRLSTTVGDLLVLSRLEQETPERTPLDLNLVAAAAAERWAHAADGAGVRLAVRPHDVPCVAECAPGDLERALDAVLENAIVYSPEGGTVELATAPGRLDVNDDGPGLADGEAEQVFERFRRGRASGAAPAGTGLGLAIAREAMERNGWTVTLANRPEGGACASLRFTST